MDFGTFGYRTCIYCTAFIEQFRPVRTHAMNNDGTCSPNASPQISIAILIPERTRVLPFRDIGYMGQRRPRTFRIFCIRHEQTFIGSTEKHPELTVMMTNGRCPRAASIMRIRIPSWEIETVIKLRYQFPVHHIFRFQHLHPHEMKIRCYHIITIAHSNHIRVGVVSIQNRIHIGSVTLVTPCFQRFLCLDLN